MRLTGSTIFLFLIILVSLSEASLRRPKTRIPTRTHAAASTCPTYPLPTPSSSAVRSKMSMFFDELATNVSAVLKAHSAKGGVSLSIVYNDTVIWNGGFDPDLGPPTGDTAFRVGSITKLFTALLMYQMRDEGLIRSIDSDVASYNTQFSIKSNFRTNRSITFKQLASHMSGLPRESPCAGIFDTGCAATRPIPTWDSHCSVALWMVVEDTTWWKNQMRARVLGPVGDGSFCTSITDDVKAYLAPFRGPFHTGLIDIGWEAPAGQLFSTTNDLAKFMALIFQPRPHLTPTSGQPEIKIGYIFLDSCDECSSHGPIIDLADQVFAEASNALAAACRLEPTPPQNPADYAGSYQTSDLTTATIQTVTILNEPILEISTDGLSGFLVWQGGDAFQLSVEWYSSVSCGFLSDGWIGEWLYFTRDSQGAVNGFTLPGEDYGNVYKKN
eukprot:Em0956g2a